MSRGRLVAAVALGALLYTGAIVLVAIADLENPRLAIVIALFRHRETLSPDVFTSLKW